MINSAQEFMHLRASMKESDYSRAARESAPIEVWIEIIENHPEFRFWVAQNKTVPAEILSILASDPDPRVRTMVAMKRKLPEDLVNLLAADSDDGVCKAIAHRTTKP